MPPNLLGVTVLRVLLGPVQLAKVWVEILRGQAVIREKTTFVIGAGASVEFGLPVGTDLAKAIKKCALIRTGDFRQEPQIGDEYLYERIHSIWQNTAERECVLEALQRIHEGIHTVVSIDAFIHRFNNDPLINVLGKMLIALEIMKAERGSTMHPKRTDYLDYQRETHPDDTWLGHFVRILLDGVENPQDIGKSLSIICFNYDRCIEYYLAQSIAAAYQIKAEEAYEIVSGMNIIHPYGTLGRLPETIHDYGEGILEFGPELDVYSRRLLDIAQNIRTYTEQAHDVETVERIHRAIAGCHNLVFLGFGFNNQNLDLLRVKHKFTGQAHPKNIYATGYGIFAQAEETLKRRILDLYLDERDHTPPWRRRVHIEYGQGCKELFRIHDMNFTSFTQRVVLIKGVDGERISRVEKYSEVRVD